MARAATPSCNVVTELAKRLRCTPTDAAVLNAVQLLADGLAGSIAANKVFQARAEQLAAELRAHGLPVPPCC